MEGALEFWYQLSGFVYSFLKSCFIARMLLRSAPFFVLLNKQWCHDTVWWTSNITSFTDPHKGNSAGQLHETLLSCHFFLFCLLIQKRGVNRKVIHWCFVLCSTCILILYKFNVLYFCILFSHRVLNALTLH